MPGAPSSASTAQAGIIGQRGMMAGIGGGARLELGIGGEGRAGLFRLGQSQLARADRLDAVRAEQRLDLAHLARIVAGDHQHVAARQASCAERLLLQLDQFADALARQAAAVAASCSSVNGAPSAVP